MVGLLARRRRSLDILSVKKEAKQSASEAPGVEDGKGDEDFRCRSLLTVCHRRLWFPEDEIAIVLPFGCQDELVVLVA